MTQYLQYKRKHPLESKHSRFRKTAYAFPTRTDATELGQVADTILLEINTFADPKPFDAMPIATLIHEFLIETDRSDLVEDHGLEAFDVLVLRVERTLCEKIMGLVCAGYEPDPLADFRRRIRHFYDIVMILRKPRYREFIGSSDFPKLLGRVRDSDRRSMPNIATWLDPPITEAMVFADIETLWENIGPEFRGSFADMVYRDGIPHADELLQTFALIRDALHGHE